MTQQRRSRTWTRSALAAAVGVLVAGCRPEPPAEPVVPRPSQRVTAENGVVAAAHPLAAAAGLDMLRRGGNAVDAAVATAFALGVVEPMMAGVGGGGSMLMWLEEEGHADYVDFYASAGADPDYALDEPRDTAAAPERMVAVPGAVAGLLSAHERYGRLPRTVVLEPAIRLARDGFRVHSLLARVVAQSEEKLTRDPAAASVFYPGGEPLQAGDWLRQPALARTLERIAREGRDGFYRGPTAEAIIAKLSAGGNPMTLDDLDRYEPHWRRPLCGTYRGHTILSAAPPLAGAEVIETLNLLEPFELPEMGLPARSGEALGVIVDAIRIARADRAAWIGFPNDVGVPAAGIASDAYAEERGALIGAGVPDTLHAGDPWDEERRALDGRCATLSAFPPTTLPRPATDTAGVAFDGEPDEAQTTHLSVVDREGNAVSLTYTMGLYFGAGVYTEGAFLNSAALNFGGPEANRRGPYRTPRSSTSPTIVLDDDDVRLVVGSPGSGRIPPAIVHSILYTLDYGLDPWTALQMPRLYPFTDSRIVRVEDGFSTAALAALRERGYTLEAHGPYDMYFGGVHLVLVRDDGRLVGAADPRRDGAAVGY